MYKIFYSILFIFFVSCSNKNIVIQKNETNKTIRSQIKDIEAGYEYSQELEPSRLNASLFTDSTVFASDINLNIESASIVPSYKKNVYPVIPDFASLDISALTSSQLDYTDNFCKLFSDKKYEDCISLFNEEYAFNFILFIHDLNDFQDNTEENQYTRWIMGQPGFSDELIEIPVRFYGNIVNLDVTLFINKNEKNKLMNIQILKLEKVDD